MPTAALLALALAAPPATSAWRLPVRGEVVRAFAYDERRPFAAGSRRGVDIAVAPGTAVWSACSGRVSHAGTVPARALGVSVRCGGLTATHLGLGSLAVRPGARVRRGQRLGRAGRSGLLRLGARVTARRFGWIDPLALVEPVPPPAAGPPQLGPGPRSAHRPPPTLRPAPLRPPTPTRPPVRSPAPRRVPLFAWLGAALLAAGLPLGAVLTLRRSRSRRPRAVASRLRG